MATRKGTVTKKDIIRQVSVSSDIPIRLARASVDATLEAIRRSVGAGMTVELRRFGVFWPRVTRERIIENRGGSGKSCLVPASIRFGFKTARTLKNLKIGGGA